MNCREEFKVIINNSTIPVGTADNVRNAVSGVLEIRGRNIEFGVVSNPELLNRNVIGTDNPRTEALMKSLYTPFSKYHENIISMDMHSSDLTKYAANVMLATSISFMNELENPAQFSISNM